MCAQPVSGGALDELAGFLAGEFSSGLPPAVVEHAKMAVASTLASAAAGAALPSVEIGRAIADEHGGAPQAVVWFSGATALPAPVAARLNAMASDAAASDDSDFRTIAHTGTAVTAASLAVGELADACGSDVLRAVAIGYEASSRFGEVTAPGLAERGFHPAALGGFGAAAASATLLRASPAQMRDALVLAATAASGVLAGTSGWTREYQAGTAVLSGVLAGLTATRGYATNPSVLDGPGGFLDAMAGTRDCEALRRGLGEPWRIATDLGIKVRPGGYPFAAAVEAAIEAARALDVAPDEIEWIGVSGPAAALAGPRHPRDFVEAIHSLAFYVATGACDREFGWGHLDEARVHDPRVRRLLDLVEIQPVGDWDFTFRFGATVTIRARGGATACRTVDVPVGSARRGIAWETVERKLLTLVQRAGHSRAAAYDLAAAVRALDHTRDVRRLTGLLTTP